MDKKLLAKQRQIILQKFLIKKKRDQIIDESYQTTELPASEISSITEKNPLHFTKNEDFLTIFQKKPQSSQLRLNLSGVKQRPTFLTARSKRKSELEGFLTERQYNNESQSLYNCNTHNFLKKPDNFFHIKTEKRRNFTLNELQFKEKFLIHRREASNNVHSNKSSSLKRASSVSFARTQKFPPKKEEKIEEKEKKEKRVIKKHNSSLPVSLVKLPKENTIIINASAGKSIKSLRNLDKNNTMSPQSPRKIEQMEKKINIFNAIFEQADLSQIFHDHEISHNKLKLDSTLFRQLGGSIKIVHNTKECLLKLNDQVLLRYNPIDREINPFKSTYSIDDFAQEKDILLFQKGFAETDICGEGKKSRKVINKEAELKEVNNECNNISRRIYHNFYEKPRNEEFMEVDNHHELSGTRLSLQDIETIKQEFEEKKENMNLDKIDFFLKKLKFFKKFSETIRMHFLKRAKFVEFPAGHIIFKQGDFGDLMYVILRGSVNIRIIKKINVYENLSTSFVVNSYYDGDHFGDLAMMSVKKMGNSFQKSKVLINNIHRIKDVRQYLEKCEEIFQSTVKKVAPANLNRENEREYLGIKENQEKNTLERTKRAATIETVEQCFCLTIGREEYQYIYTNILQKVLEDKLSAIMSCSIFEGIEAYNLLPLANILEEKNYKLGEVIINKGDIVENFFIVAKGKCDLILEYEETKDLDTFKRFQNKGFRMKEIGDREIFEKPKKKPIQKLNEEVIYEGLSPRNFPNTQKIHKKYNTMNINHHHVIRSFMRGDSFGERALLTDIDLDNKALSMNKGKISRTTRLNVIVDMNNTKVYSVKQTGFQAIPIELKNEVRNILSSVREFDDFDIDSMENQRINWEATAKKYIRWKMVQTAAKKSNNLFKLSHME